MTENTSGHALTLGSRMQLADDISPAADVGICWLVRTKITASETLLCEADNCVRIRRFKYALS